MTHPLKTELGSMLCPLALNAEMEGEAEGGTPSYQAPDWIPILPAPSGSLLKGVDGRVFDMDDLQRVVSDSPMPAALDFDHAGALAPFAAQPGKAAARIVELQVRDDETTWGKVAWTEAGRAAVESGEYLFISPVLQVSYSSDGPPEVKYISGAGLVNFPNFRVMPSINHQEFPSMSEEQTQTTTTVAVTETQPPAESAANAGTDVAAMREELAELRRERNERETASEAAINALRTELAAEREARETDRKAQRETAINAALDQAITDRKITPAQRDYFLAQCQKENGLEEFQSFVAAQPQMLGDSGLEGRTPPGGDGQATLSAEDQAFCAKAGLDPAEYLKTKQAEQAANGDLPPSL